MAQNVKYVIVTPVRDEEKHIEATIAAVAGQTIRPAEWVIVNDGSSDRTGDIIDRCAAKFPWISVVHRSNRGFRKSGGGVIEAFYEGYNALHCHDWEFIVKLDGDLTFPAEYFEKCFEHFEQRTSGSAWAEEISITISVESRNSRRIPGFMSEEQPRFTEGPVGKRLAVY